MAVNLHNHDHKGSVRDAIASPEGIVERIKELGQTAYAITNHGSTSSLLTHYKLSKKNGLKFIFGLEAYICDDITIKAKYDYRHLCLFAKDLNGYKNLLKLATLSHTKGFYYKPRIDWDMLVAHKEGLIASSACLGGILGIKNEDGSFDKRQIYNVAEKYKKEFGDDFWIELYTNTMPEQVLFNNILVGISEALAIPVIATCDAHYVYKSEASVHRYWNGIDENDESDYYQTDDFYLHSEQEMLDALMYLGEDIAAEAVRNTEKLAEQCNVEIAFGEDNFPIYKCDSQVETVKSICREGWKNKIIGKIGVSERQKYLERFTEEMETLEKANYLNMMLITWDYMKWGQDNGIRFGCGRGSVGASLVAYLMDITKVDPIKNNLTFSRFCNLARVTTADIDVDVQQCNRQKVIDYLREKYGYVYQVRTFNSMDSRGALQRAGQCLNVPIKTVREISGKIVESLDDLEITKENKELVDLAHSFKGITANTSVHASAVLVFPKDPTEFCAIEKQGDNLVAAYDYHELEELGLAKIDVLGLKNMDIIEDTLQLLRERGIELDINHIPLNDTKTSELLCKGNTQGVFQIESEMMKCIVKGIQPKGFDDLIAVVALGRPAPLQLGIVDEYIKKRKAKLKGID